MSKENGSSSSGGSPFFPGLFWFAGWLFTIAFAKLIWWKAVLAFLLWPYYLGAVISVVPG